MIAEYVELECGKYKKGEHFCFRTGVWCEVLGTYYKVVDDLKKDIVVKVKMTLTDYEQYIPQRNMETCSGYDPYQPRIAGVGYVGEGQYKARKPQRDGGKKYKSYACWENMLWRVYDKKHRLANRYIGRGVTVCDEWHSLQNFVPWFLDNYPYKEGFALDSDIFRKGDRKIYSPDTCVFIPQDINKFFGAMNENRGEWPVGVSQDKYGMFTASVHHADDYRNETGFKDPDSAFLWYKKHKEDYLRGLAKKHFELGNINDETYLKLLDWRAVPYPD